MAFTRVQATPKGTGGTSVTCTFSAPPIIGNGIVVIISGYNSTAVTALSDNRGHTYLLADSKVSSSLVAAVYYLPIITITGSPFTITLNVIGGQPTIVAVEVSGVGTGLAVDKSITNSGNSINPTTGVTTALTGSEVFLAAAIQTDAGFTTFDVIAPWIQEYESIPFTNPSGEGNTRIVVSASGTTQSCSWTLNASGGYASALAAFKVATSSGGISQPPVVASVSPGGVMTFEPNVIAVMPCQTVLMFTTDPSAFERSLTPDFTQIVPITFDANNQALIAGGWIRNKSVTTARAVFKKKKRKK